MILHRLLLLSLLLQPTSEAKVAPPDCPDSCGNITIPYPFGLTPGCFANGFKLTCTYSYDPPKLFIGTGNIEITKISSAIVFINGLIARDCYNEPSVAAHVWMDLNSLPFSFSYTRNKFTAIGCDAVALVYRTVSNFFSSGCMSLCRNAQSVVNGSCGGIGCCQTAIPKGYKRFDTMLQNFNNHTRTWSFSPCSYAFLIDAEQYEFDISDFYNSVRGREFLWFWIGQSEIRLVQRLRGNGNLLCGAKSDCLESRNGPGYRCSCIDGYEGNPYLSNGCQDINECEDPGNSPCVDICNNTPGSYTCSCSHGSSGDGRKNGSGCTSSNNEFPLVKVVLANNSESLCRSGLGLVFLVLITTLSYLGLKKRRLLQLKDAFFKQNGGLLLQKKISSREGAAESARIFTSMELEKATANYSPTRILGVGGSGTVYKGILPDKRVVAIKKSKIIDTNQIEPFINEVVILSKVIHRNVVKILGCCLEMQVPLLVYEYVSNGTLSHHLHDANRASSLSWEACLRIAAEAARALAYLHSATTRPIIYRDVKSANMLLDDNYTAKVSDFGASRMIPLGRAELTTLVQGTLGYLDSEYFHTGQLTEKSDVYSFGVVLVELLTGERPISLQRPEEEKMLSKYFILSMERNLVFDILESRIVSEGDRAQLQEIAELAQRCLHQAGEERPTMKEVAEELELTKSQRRPWDEQDDQEETGRLLNDLPSMPHGEIASSDGQSFGSDIIEQ